MNLRTKAKTKKGKNCLALTAIVLLGALLRFYKLDWGSEYFFHPDEYHIAAAVERLSFPHQMNPQFFSYGSFTAYLIYFTQKFFYQIIANYGLRVTSFTSAILIGRFYSALFSTLTILLVYLISRRLFTVCCSLFTAALCAVMSGSIQQAHFATPESTLTFWLLLTLLMALKFLETRKHKYIYLAAASQGLAMGTKITAITFFPVVLLAPVLTARPVKIGGIGLISLIRRMSVLLLITLFSFFLSFPYAFLDWQGMKSSWNYETGVAWGTLPVFYTRQFINTTPILFQLQKVFPYTLGPGVLVLGSLGLLGCLWHIGKRLTKKDLSLITYHLSLITISFLCYFLPNTFLFAKWTRFMAPIFPFFAIFTGYFLSLIKNKNLLSIIYCLLSIITFFWILLFFSIYLHPDVRITATDWLNQNLPQNSFILTESGNMLEVPLKGNLQKKPFDFYNLEEQPELRNQLPELLAQADYFIIQSRRIFANHQQLPQQFPKTARFYNLLFSDQLGFVKIKEFSSFPQFSVHGSRFTVHDEMAEETWSVFDHPVIRIYKKTKILTENDYEKLLKI